MSARGAQGLGYCRLRAVGLGSGRQRVHLGTRPRPGFGCVGDTGAGQCLPYCCGGDDTCGDNRYCDKRPMRSLEFDDTTNSVPDVPVCVAAEQCELDVAPEGDQSDAKGNEPNSCPEGTACTIVRADTTACRPTGKGIEGEACPCGGGFFCSRVTNTCLKLCNTTDPRPAVNASANRDPVASPKVGAVCGWLIAGSAKQRSRPLARSALGKQRPAPYVGVFLQIRVHLDTQK